MRRSILLFATAALCALLALGRTRDREVEREDVASPTEVFEAGVIPDGVARIEHLFTLRNSGTDRWVVKEIVTSCSCVVTERAPFVIEPAQTRSLLVGIDLAAVGGPFTSYVRLKGDGIPGGFLEVGLRATVQRALTLSPARVDFGSVQPGGASERQVLVSAAGQDIIVTALSDIPGVTCRVERRDQASAAVTLTWRPPEDGRRLEGSISLSARGTLEVTRTVPVAGQVEEEVSASPRMLLMVKGRPSTTTVCLGRRCDLGPPLVEGAREGTEWEVKELGGARYRIVFKRRMETPATKELLTILDPSRRHSTSILLLGG